MIIRNGYDKCIWVHFPYHVLVLLNRLNDSIELDLILYALALRSLVLPMDQNGQFHYQIVKIIWIIECEIHVWDIPYNALEKHWPNRLN